MIKHNIISNAWILIIFGLTACAPMPLDISEQHISSDSSATSTGAIPKPVLNTTPAALNQPSESEDVYSVVVNDVDLRELLFALSRDASLNIDIAPDITGTVTLNAVDQTLPQILDRITAFSDIRYSIKNDVLVIEKDKPYFVHYDIGYLNMDRSSQSFVSISTEVATTGVGAVEGSSSGGEGNNNSSTIIENRSDYHFWDSLIQNVEAIIYGGDSTGSIATSGESASEASSEIERTPIADTSIIANAESGVLSIKTSKKKHHEVQTFLDEVLNGAKRQVLIEASIVEVSLSDEYQAGVNWSKLIESGDSGFSFTQDLIGTNLANAPVSTLTYTGANSDSLNATVKLLNQFGNAKVLSTPKLMVLNNQTALLKVVDNIIYFTIDVEEDIQENFINRTFTSEIHSVPVGLVMSVTPQISNVDSVTLNVRPTISRVLKFVEDPNPALAESDTTSLIPEISVREMESVMQVNGGDTAIIGGLMQDEHGDDTSGVPGLSKLPWVGDLFSYKDKSYKKSELIIFIRPTVIKQANLSSTELKRYEEYLPENLQ